MLHEDVVKVGMWLEHWPTAVFVLPIPFRETGMRELGVVLLLTSLHLFILLPGKIQYSNVHLNAPDTQVRRYLCCSIGDVLLELRSQADGSFWQ